MTTARLLVAVDELERRDIPRMGYRFSITGWLTRFLVMSGREASGLVKTARSLAKMTSARIGALSGELSSGAVRVLAVACDRYPDEFLHSEDVLVNAGVTLMPRELQHLLSVWGQQVNHADAFKDTTVRVERRSLFWS